MLIHRRSPPPLLLTHRNQQVKKFNIDVVCEYLVNRIPVPPRDFTSSPRLIVIRSFDVNKPGELVDDLKGGCVGWLRDMVGEGQRTTGRVDTHSPAYMHAIYMGRNELILCTDAPRTPTPTPTQHRNRRRGGRVHSAGRAEAWGQHRGPPRDRHQGVYGGRDAWRHDGLLLVCLLSLRRPSVCLSRPTTNQTLSHQPNETLTGRGGEREVRAHLLPHLLPLRRDQQARVRRPRRAHRRGALRCLRIA